MHKLLKVGREILVQIIPVAIGVYLGLIVNDWNNNRITRERKIHSRELIAQEIEVNKAKVEEGLQYHLMLLDSLNRLIEKEAVRFKDLGFWQGVRTPTLYSGAYQSATLSNTINSFSIKEIHSIVETYSIQKKYDDMNMIAMQGLIQQDFYNEENLKETLVFLRILLTDLSYSEKNLLASYEQTLNVLEN